MAIKQVLTKYGFLEGMEAEADVTLFAGIPFASPPVGKLRWKRPLPPKSWAGVRRADRFACVPPQGAHISEVPKRDLDLNNYYTQELVWESEDCLYLNLWTPARRADEKLAVMFWIPGGGFTTGYTYEKQYDGIAMARKGVILVTAAHRLGALGFLSHPLLQDCEGLSGNYALYDLLAALDWVRENIAAFGGDPENVTIFGQSSGEVAVQVLLGSPLARGKFKRAIMQSGRGVGSEDLMDTKESALWKGENFMRVMGAQTKEQMYALSPDDMFLTLYRLRKATFGPDGRPDTFRTVPEQRNPGRLLYHVDGEAMTALLDEAAVQGLNQDVDVIIGSCETEGGGDTGVQRAQVALNWCENQLKTGKKPSYLYLFARSLPGDARGAYHGCELWYEFGTLKRGRHPFEAADYGLSEIMIAYWTNFARTGNPNGEGVPLWRPYTGDSRVRMRLDVRSGEEAVGEL